VVCVSPAVERCWLNPDPIGAFFGPVWAAGAIGAELAVCKPSPSDSFGAAVGVWRWPRGTAAGRGRRSA
jgi:hypothetical protein